MKPLVVPLALAIVAGASTSSRAQGAAAAAPPTTTQQPAPGREPLPTLEDTIDAAEADGEDPRRQFVRWNEYEGPFVHVRFGGGFLYEGAAYSQDPESRQQFGLATTFKVRDTRVLLKGSLPRFKRKVTFSSGIMFDAPTSSWLVRETGVMIAIPELWGNLFIGRTKEGFSLNKVMVGYAGWTIERAPINDATIPILADGIKWLGYSPKHGFLWNLGFYNDVLSEGQTFSSYEHQAVARIAWLPIHSEEKATVFHVGMNLRRGTVEDGKLQLRSRPEAFPAPYFIDTGKFDASSTRMAGYEIYYRNHGLLLGSEYWFQDVSSPTTSNPHFSGGDVVAAWVVTGEPRAYNTVGGYFLAVSPDRPVFSGGPGAWEVVTRFSNIDLNGGTLRGGKFWRFTPMLNWYLSDNVRLEFVYGYGHLERFDVIGKTHFFQSRIQLQL